MRKHNKYNKNNNKYELKMKKIMPAENIFLDDCTTQFKESKNQYKVAIANETK